MKKNDKRDGGVLIMVVIALLAVGFLSAGFFKLQETDAVETVHVDLSNQAFWVAESGLQRSLDKLRDTAGGFAYRKSVSNDAAYPTEESDEIGTGSYLAELWGNGSGTHFWIRSRGTVNGFDRVLALAVVINEFGPHGLITMDGNSTIRGGATINGGIYQNGKLITRGTVNITGDVLADNYSDFGDKGYPIPEDGYIDMHIDQTYFSPFLSMALTAGASVTSNTTLNLNNSTVVMDAVKKGDSTEIINGPGILVIKGDQVFDSNLTIGSDVTLIVDGNLTISKDGTLGDNVTLFATGVADLFKDAEAAAVTGTGCAILTLAQGAKPSDNGIKVWKDFTFDGLIMTEKDFYANLNMNVTGTIVTRDGFELKNDATVTFNEGLIPDNVREDMVSSTFIVSQSHWNELPPN
jgi:hypothetical protein